MNDESLTLKQKVDNHTGIFFLGTLIAGFVAGITCYYKSLDLFQYAIITQDRKQELEEAKLERDKLKDHVIELRIKLASLKQITQEEIMEPIMKLESYKKQQELQLIESQKQEKIKLEKERKELEKKKKEFEKQEKLRLAKEKQNKEDQKQKSSDDESPGMIAEFISWVKFFGILIIIGVVIGIIGGLS